MILSEVTIKRQHERIKLEISKQIHEKYLSGATPLEESAFEDLRTAVYEYVSKNPRNLLLAGERAVFMDGMLIGLKLANKKV